MFLWLHSLRYKEGSELNRVAIDAAGDGVNTLYSGYFLAFAIHRPTPYKIQKQSNIERMDICIIK